MTYQDKSEDELINDIIVSVGGTPDFENRDIKHLIYIWAIQVGAV